MRAGKYWWDEIEVGLGLFAASDGIGGGDQIFDRRGVFKRSAPPSHAKAAPRKLLYGAYFVRCPGH